MKKLATIAVRIALTEVDSCDCEYGCWTTGYGVEVLEQEVPGDKNTEKVIYEQEAWASCLDSSMVDWEHLEDFLEELHGKHVAVILDIGDTSDYPERFLEKFL